MERPAQIWSGLPHGMILTLLKTSRVRVAEEKLKYDTEASSKSWVCEFSIVRPPPVDKENISEYNKCQHIMSKLASGRNKCKLDIVHNCFADEKLGIIQIQSR